MTEIEILAKSIPGSGAPPGKYSTIRFVVSAGALVAASACTCGKSAPTSSAPGPSATASGSAVKALVQPQEVPDELRVPSSWPVPTGPRLAILAGQGVGPIRLGATFATIERLMERPCDERTADACRYFGRAIEFKMKDGVAVEMHLHRRDRPAAPDGNVFGVFNGRTPEGVTFLMLPSGTEELLGKPQKIEAVSDPNPWGMVEVRHYPGMGLEFDRLSTGKVVLGGIVITKPDSPK